MGGLRPDTGCDPSEEALLLRIEAGDQEAFGRLFGRYVHVLEDFARQWLPPPVRRRISAADVVQEASMVALRRLSEFEPQGEHAFRNWLLKIVEFKAREAVRSHGAKRRASGREVTRDRRPETHEMAGAGPSPSEVAIPSWRRTC